MDSGASLGVSGAAVCSIGACSITAGLRLRRTAFTFGAAGAEAAAARVDTLRGVAAFLGAAALRAPAAAFFGATARRVLVAALARAPVLAGFAATLRVVALVALRVVAALRADVFVAAAAARFGAALRAAGFFAVARLAAGLPARVAFAAVLLAGAFRVAAFALVVFAVAFFAGAFFAAVFAFVARAAGFAAALRVPAPRTPRVPVAPAARRVVARTAIAWARGWSPLLSSLLTSGFSLSAVDGYGSLVERPRARPHPQDAKLAHQRS